jgi:hypothetical protein
MNDFDRATSASTSIPATRNLAGWRQCTLTRANELGALNDWIRHTYESTAPGEAERYAALQDAITRHLDAARDAVTGRWTWPWRKGALLEQTSSNLDAAETDLLRVAPSSYVTGQMPNVVNHVERHLAPADPRRREVEQIAARFGVSALAQSPAGGPPDPDDVLTEQERGRIVGAVRGASSAALREQIRLRSFRNVIVVTSGALTVFAIVLAIIGWRSPDTIPLCFAPEEGGEIRVVCPTEQSGPVPTPGAATEVGVAAEEEQDIDDLVRQTAKPEDIVVVELVGLSAAAIAAARAIRGLRGSSERHGVPQALAVLKLPTGAVTAFLGLLLMRGGFVPGLSALDTSAQILAWAIVFGYAQQLFTGMVDQQAQSVLSGVRGGNKSNEPDRSE